MSSDVDTSTLNHVNELTASVRGHDGGEYNRRNTNKASKSVPSIESTLKKRSSAETTTTVKEESPNTDEQSPSKKAKKVPEVNRMRRAPEKISSTTPLARNKDDVSEADRMVIRMRDEGKTWNEIRVAWKALTGNDVATSTLPNRYIRIKANMMTFSDEEDKMLLDTKQQIELTFEKEKWAMIAQVMRKAGGDKYTPAAIQKRFRDLSRQSS